MAVNLVNCLQRNTFFVARKQSTGYFVQFPREFLVQEEQKRKQVQPQCTHEMPVNAEGLEPDHIARVDGPQGHTYAIDNEVNKPENEVQNVHRNQGPQVPPPELEVRATSRVIGLTISSSFDA